MGNSTSSNDEYEYDENQDQDEHAQHQDNDDEYAKQFDGIDTLGYRVLGVQPDSPGKFFTLFFCLVMHMHACICMTYSTRTPTLTNIFYYNTQHPKLA
jgi:hypothetical protein